MTSPSHSRSDASVPEDHVALILLETKDSSFYLQAAKERHLKKVGENTWRLEQWRGGMPQVSV
jgi:hypothetical protein